MPTREQMDAVVREIEAWLGGLEVVRIEDKPGIPAPEARRFLFWDEMTEAYRKDALASEIDWKGFTEGQKDNVIRRVLDGQDAKFWMDGIASAGGNGDLVNRAREAAGERRDNDGPEQELGHRGDRER